MVGVGRRAARDAAARVENDFEQLLVDLKDKRSAMNELWAQVRLRLPEIREAMREQRGKRRRETPDSTPMKLTRPSKARAPTSSARRKACNAWADSPGASSAGRPPRFRLDVADDCSDAAEAVASSEDDDDEDEAEEEEELIRISAKERRDLLGSPATQRARLKKDREAEEAEAAAEATAEPDDVASVDAPTPKPDLRCQSPMDVFGEAVAGMVPYLPETLPETYRGELRSATEALKGKGDACVCSGCRSLDTGGWAWHCAQVTLSTSTATTVRRSARAALKVINETFIESSKDGGGDGGKPPYCHRSFEAAMVARKLLDLRSGKEGWGGFTMLRNLCLGLARHEVAVRLVQSGYVVAVQPEQEHTTRALFEALRGFPAFGRPYKKLRGILDFFLPEVQQDKVDMLTWQELYEGIPGLNAGSPMHLISARATFEARCAQPQHLPASYYDYILETHQFLQASKTASLMKATKA